AAGPHPLPLDVRVLHLDLHVVRLGHDGHGGGRCVNAALRFGLWHSLHAMAAALETQLPIGAFPRDAEDDVLEAAGLAWAERNVFDLPALLTGEMRVHVVEDAGE